MDREGTPRTCRAAIRADLLGLLGGELDPAHRLAAAQQEVERDWRSADRNPEEEA
jgi:hypothetical protein